MNDPMKLLKADHREVAKMLKELSATEDPKRRSKMVDELTRSLAAHMAIEEALVYPLIASALDEETEVEADTEHALAREGIEKLAAMCDQPGFGAVVEMVQAGIHHHVEEEENEILPELKDALDTEQWRELGDQIAEQREAAGLKGAPAPTRRANRRPAAAGSSRK